METRKKLKFAAEAVLGYGLSRLLEPLAERFPIVDSLALCVLDVALEKAEQALERDEK